MKNAKEIMDALLGGETLQNLEYAWQTAELEGGALAMKGFNVANELFCRPLKWRVKPKVQQLNGIEVPTPHRKKLENGQEYFTPSVNNLTGYRDYIWRNSHTDNRRLNAGVIHLEPEAAAQHTKAFLSLTAE